MLLLLLLPPVHHYVRHQDARVGPRNPLAFLSKSPSHNFQPLSPEDHEYRLRHVMLKLDHL